MSRPLRLLLLILLFLFAFSLIEGPSLAKEQLEIGGQLGPDGQSSPYQAGAPADLTAQQEREGLEKLGNLGKREKQGEEKGQKEEGQEEEGVARLEDLALVWAADPRLAPYFEGALRYDPAAYFLGLSRADLRIEEEGPKVSIGSWPVYTNKMGQMALGGYQLCLSAKYYGSRPDSIAVEESYLAYDKGYYPCRPWEKTANGYRDLSQLAGRINIEKEHRDTYTQVWIWTELPFAAGYYDQALDLRDQEVLGDVLSRPSPESVLLALSFTDQDGPLVLGPAERHQGRVEEEQAYGHSYLPGPLEEGYWGLIWLDGRRNAADDIPIGFF